MNLEPTNIPYDLFVRRSFSNPSEISAGKQLDGSARNQIDGSAPNKRYVAAHGRRDSGANKPNDHLEQRQSERLDLLCMVGHDLRAPLTAVRIALDMLKEGNYGSLSSRGHEVLEQAVAATQYINSLVVNLIDAAKAENGSIELDYEVTTLGAVVDTAICAVDLPIGKKLVSIKRDVSDGEVIVDAYRIVQILTNLLSNAIKYSPDNSIVRLTAAIDRRYIVFQVIDQGPGIAKEMQSVIFEPYRQLSQPKNMKRQGLGLGLSICKMLVELHHGHIWVESEENKGSKFCFTIPISPTNPETTA